MHTQTHRDSHTHTNLTTRWTWVSRYQNISILDSVGTKEWYGILGFNVPLDTV